MFSASFRLLYRDRLSAVSSVFNNNERTYVFMKIKLAPSVLAANMLKLGEEIDRAVISGSDMLHCDVMDGVYVPNISFGFGVISQIHSITDLPLDVHMMTSVPEKYLDVLKKSGADNVTVHHDVSSVDGIKAMLNDIHSLGMKASVAISPKIPAEAVFPFIELADMILVMTVEPGFGGQSFMDMSDKVRDIKARMDQIGICRDIQVDGGINANTAKIMRDAGANVFVVGTGAFRAPDMKAALDAIRG